MMNPPFSIKVPGSTSNLGPGFDSIGLAVNRYLQLVVTPSDTWSFVSKSPETDGIPGGKENLIYQAARVTAGDRAEQMPPCMVEVSSDIPMARGLGSSGAAIVAGIELADHLLDLHLCTQEKIRIATLFEGHPDNVSASVLGGLVIGTHTELATEVIKAGNPPVDLVAVIPGYELKTSSSRSVLPDTLSMGEAVKAASIGNVLVASMMQGDWERAGRMMELDRFHEPYRKSLVPELERVRQMARELGAYSAVLSGAGPTVLLFVPNGMGQSIKEILADLFVTAKVECLEPEESGSAINVLESNERG